MTGATTDALEVLAPASTSVTFGGRVVELTPLRAGQLPALIRTVRPVLDVLLGMGGAEGEVNLELPVLLGLLGDHGDAVFTALHLTTGVPEQELRDAEIDQVLVLAQAAVAVNRDFFLHKLVPLLAGMAKQPVGAGPTPSSS